MRSDHSYRTHGQGTKHNQMSKAYRYVRARDQQIKLSQIARGVFGQDTLSMSSNKRERNTYSRILISSTLNVAFRVHRARKL